MKNRFSPLIRLLKKELEYRNYSPFTIRVHCEAMLGFEKHAAKTLFDSCTDDLKDYLHYLITQKNCSTSYVNQNISAFEIFTEDVLKHEWTGLEVRRPRPSKRIPDDDPDHVHHKTLKIRTFTVKASGHQFRRGLYYRQTR